MKNVKWKIAGLFMALMGAVTLASAGQGEGQGHHRKGDKHGQERDGGRPSREEIRDRYDKDGDGKLSESELEQLKKDRDARQDKSGERPTREEIIERFDKDGDGELNEEERAAARKAMGQHKGGPDGERPSREEILEKFDTDGDGELSEEERKAMREAFEARRREQRGE